MWKYLAAVLSGAVVGGGVFFAISQANKSRAGHPMQMATPSAGAVAVKTIDMTGKTDMHNTRCPVSGDEVGDSKLMVEYQGKVYHICCEDCIDPFNKDPEKYVKVMEADPAKFGLAAAATKP